MSAKMKKAKADEYISQETFAEIEGAFQEARAHARGERTDLRTTRVRLPTAPKRMNHEQIVTLRGRLNYSQAAFALLLNVSVKSIQGWEQGLREPSEAALKLLAVAEKHPEALLDS
jgi:putative transcriptional regulator